MCYLLTAWAEDRALLGSNPSAVPGAKTEGGRSACLAAFLLPSGLAPMR